MVLELDPAEVADALRAGELDVALIHEYDFAADPAHRGLATTALRTEAMSTTSPRCSPSSRPVRAWPSYLSWA
ncbi:hypothetical protein [Microtetraspora glauca]|uniref:LysR substrate-binding domain-containing protein n=1 Tax=Microtetraspora glauca TaxID=1996 RepID=A0ABV3GH56_MICGL